jgi:hypothetical protein
MLKPYEVIDNRSSKAKLLRDAIVDQVLYKFSRFLNRQSNIVRVGADCPIYRSIQGSEDAHDPSNEFHVGRRRVEAGETTYSDRQGGGLDQARVIGKVTAFGRTPASSIFVFHLWLFGFGDLIGMFLNMTFLE